MIRRWYIRDPIIVLLLGASYTFMRAATLFPQTVGWNFGAQDVCMIIACTLAFGAGGFAFWASNRA